MYRGDIRLEDTIDFKFTSRAFSTGIPTTLAGSPVISAYIGNSTTQITAGITLSVDFDSVTGLNNVRVAATAANGYTAPTNVELVITTGTVGGVSVVGEVIGAFSIEARSAVMPTTPAAKLDVTATGAAGIDWGNVENKTTANALTATSIITTQKVDVETIKTNPVVNAGTITFPTTATLASTTNITAGALTSVGTLTTYTGNTVQTGDSFARIGATGSGLTSLASAANLATANGNINDIETLANSIAVDVAAILDDTGTSGVVVAAASKTGYALSAGGVDAIWDEVMEGAYTARQYMRLYASALAGILGGAATTTVAIRDTGDTKDRITATVDASGNRSAVTLDVS